MSVLSAAIEILKKAGFSTPGASVIFGTNGIVFDFLTSLEFRRRTNRSKEPLW